MSDKFVPRVGAIFSADIAVPEHEREARFYMRVLTTGDNPLWQERELFNNLGMPIIGLGKREGEYADLPLQWMPHVQVQDVAASAQTAVALGGNEIMHARDDQGSSQWAVLTDPNGAAFGIIPVLPTGAADQYDGGENPAGADAFGHIAWLDLTVPDAEGTRDFYSQVIGWESDEVAMEDENGAYADYGMDDASGKTAAGICHARGQNVGVPPVWILYLAVGDLEESLRRVEEEDGRILKKGLDGSGVMQYAVIEDPVGVAIGLVPGG